MTVMDNSTSLGVERPASVAEAAALLHGTRGPLLFRGAGTKQAWGGRITEPALVVETAELSRLLAYNPADMTVAVEAGMALRDLQEILGEKGQWLALDPPSAATGATVGGLLATGDSGPRRLRYGALRDLVIGVTLVLSDGTVAHGGGTVIKNVAGYDLPKLLYGSLGTLGLVAEVVLRLHPRPETSATVTVASSVDRAGDVALRLLASPLEPSAVDWVQTGGGLLAVRLEGTRAGVEAQRRAVVEMLTEDGARADWHTGADEDALWQELTAPHRPAPDATLAYVGTLPSRTTDVARTLAEGGEAGGATTELASRPALGLHTARFTGAPDGVAKAFEAWRAQLLGMGARVVLHERPADVEVLVDALGPAPSSAGLLQALLHRFDPDRRCGPGRLGPWLAPSPTREDTPQP
jgi:glycolate oxidase FAD binding subunit